jgi:hypothetical protein
VIGPGAAHRRGAAALRRACHLFAFHLSGLRETAGEPPILPRRTNRACPPCENCPSYYFVAGSRACVVGQIRCTGSDVATFAASCAQSRALDLPPWQPPPCNIGNMASALTDTDEQRGYRAAALLRQRMARCGVSRWHPDPVAACEAAEAEAKGVGGCPL